MAEKQIQAMRRELERCVDAAGGPGDFCAALGVSRHVLWNWRKRDPKIAPDAAQQCANLWGARRDVLCPGHDWSAQDRLHEPAVARELRDFFARHGFRVTPADALDQFLSRHHDDHA